jgi:hypothetical protein
MLAERIKEISINSKYWEGDVVYTGPLLSIGDLRGGAEEIREELLDKATETAIKNGVRGEGLREAISMTLLRKDFLIPSRDSSGVIDIRGDLELLVYRETISSDCCPPTRALLDSYHDLIAHRLIDPLVDSPSYTGSINLHYIFGSILRPLFSNYYSRGFDRREILDRMSCDLTNYLGGYLTLIDKEGRESRVDRLESKEALQLQEHHYRELATSYYQRYLYRRYDPARTYGEMILSTDLEKRLEEVYKMPYTTVYEDSFYIRDEVIQAALRRLI